MYSGDSKMVRKGSRTLYDLFLSTFYPSSSNRKVTKKQPPQKEKDCDTPHSPFFLMCIREFMG